MWSLGSARAALMLYQNARAVSGAADHLGRYIGPLLRAWSAADAELVSLVETLGVRGDSLLPAVAFLQAWASDKGSALAAVVYQARDTLHRIETFLAQTMRQQRDQHAAMAEAEKEALCRRMRGYLREIDFLLASLNLAVAVASASAPLRPLPPAGATCMDSAGRATIPASEASPPRYISPSSLLSASERLKSLADSSGDLCVAYGSLYIQTARHAGSFGAAVRRATEHSPEPPPQHAAPTARWLTPMSTVSDAHSANSASGEAGPADMWSTNESHFSPSFTLQSGVVRASEAADAPDAEWAQVSPTMQQPLLSPAAPLAALSLSDGSQRVDSFAAIPTASVVDAASQSQARASPSPVLPANTLSPWRQVWPSACLKLVRNGGRGVYELHVSSLASSSSDGLSRPAASTLKFDVDSALDFRSTSSRQLGLLEDESARRRCSGLVDAVFSFEERVANVLQHRLAFMLHLVDEAACDATAAAPSSPAGQDDALRPLDIAYLARLCMYENMHAQAETTTSSTAPLSSRSLGARSGGLRHTSASDEELWLLLAGVSIHGHSPAPAAATP